jgi:hypothetical protein
VLVGEERIGAEGEQRGVGPKRPGPGFDQVHGEVVRAGRLERRAAEPQALGADRPAAGAGSYKSSVRLRSPTVVPARLCPS